MTLSVSMAKDEELGSCLTNATYALKKRSGCKFCKTMPQDAEKRGTFMFSAQAPALKHFEGDVFDVSQDGAPCVRYAKPMFMGVNCGSYLKTYIIKP